MKGKDRKKGGKRKKRETRRHNEREPRTNTEILHKVLLESRKCCVCTIWRDLVVCADVQYRDCVSVHRKTQLSDPYVHRASVVASCFHPWKRSVLHPWSQMFGSPFCLMGSPKQQQQHRFKASPDFFFHLSSSHAVGMWCMYGVNIGVKLSYMYTLAWVLLASSFLTHKNAPPPQKKLSTTCYFYKLRSNIWIGKCQRRAV